MASNATTSNDRIDQLISQCWELVYILEEEIELLRNQQYDQLGKVNERKDTLHTVLNEIFEAGVELASDDPRAERLRAVQARLNETIARNLKMNEAHQHTMQRLFQAVRDSSLEAENDGTYTAKPGSRRPQHRHGSSRKV